MEKFGWASVRCIFCETRGAAQFYEERITLWRATGLDEAIALAEDDAREYAETVGVNYVGFTQAFLCDEPVHGAEVFSLVRESTLDTDAYLDRHFDTGGERQEHVAK